MFPVQHGRRATDHDPGQRARSAFTQAQYAVLDAQADLIARQEAELTRLRREVVILTGRWEKTA